MKKLSLILALVALSFAEIVSAASAVATSTSGTVSFQTGTGPSHPLRAGDEVRQGDTVFTGSNSSAVLKFDDGQVAALTSNTRMVITAYEYSPSTGSGNVFLSLIGGGMRALTGLIGKSSPKSVGYRAATATIGIRGTDCVVVTDSGFVVVTVSEGTCTLQLPGKDLIDIPAGQAVLVRPDGTIVRGTIQQIMAQLPPGLLALVNGSSAVNVSGANPGQPRQGQDGDQGGTSQGGTNQPGGQGQQGAGGGGGGASRQ